MTDFLQVIQDAALFAGMSEKEIKSVLVCLSATTADYSKNQFILHVGDSVDAVGMVLSGSVHILKEDFWGNRNLLAKVMPRQLFAESYACTAGATLAVDAAAAEPCTILYLNVRRVLTTCSSTCAFHARLIQNLLATMAEKNLLLSSKLSHLSKRTTKDKLLSYLSEEADKQKSNAFEIPFNRQQLADYLSVDRSAMSSELGRMRDAGILHFSGKRFELLA